MTFRFAYPILLFLLVAVAGWAFYAWWRKPASITYSVDGGGSFDVVGKLTVKDEKGDERAAVPADFTHIRWTITEPIDPGDTGTVSFRAVLE